MDAIQQKQMAQANLRTNESLAIQLRNTLKRIERDDFGVCEICGKEMPIERMRAVPEATACVPCLSGK